MESKKNGSTILWVVLAVVLFVASLSAGYFFARGNVGESLSGQSGDEVVGEQQQVESGGDVKEFELYEVDEREEEVGDAGTLKTVTIREIRVEGIEDNNDGSALLTLQTEDYMNDQQIQLTVQDSVLVLLEDGATKNMSIAELSDYIIAGDSVQIQVSFVPSNSGVSHDELENFINNSDFDSELSSTLLAQMAFFGDAQVSENDIEKLFEENVVELNKEVFMVSNIKKMEN